MKLTHLKFPDEIISNFTEQSRNPVYVNSRTVWKSNLSDSQKQQISSFVNNFAKDFVFFRRTINEFWGNGDDELCEEYCIIKSITWLKENPSVLRAKVNTVTVHREQNNYKLWTKQTHIGINPNLNLGIPLPYHKFQKILNNFFDWVRLDTLGKSLTNTTEL